MPLRLSSILILSLILTIAISDVQSDEVNKKTIAVLYLENNSLHNKEQLTALSKGLTDMLITEMSKIEALKVIERTELQKLLEEMELGMTGVIDDETAQQVGKLLGAQTLLLGSFTNLYGGKLRIDVRIVEVETGLILKAEEETGKIDKLFDMVKKLTKKIAKNLEVKLTKQDRERLKETENESFDAALLYSKGLQYQDQHKYDEALKMYKKALFINPHYSKAKQRIKEINENLEYKP